jgi:hypothetical protein
MEGVIRMSVKTSTVDTTTKEAAQELENRILSLLAELPLESLVVVERFVRFLHEQARRGETVTVVSEKPTRPPYRYPTVAVPASSLSRWLDLVPEGYEGDALADTEALYDENYTIE